MTEVWIPIHMWFVLIWNLIGVQIPSRLGYETKKKEVDFLTLLEHWPSPKKEINKQIAQIRQCQCPRNSGFIWSASTGSDQCNRKMSESDPSNTILMTYLYRYKPHGATHVIHSGRSFGYVAVANNRKHSAQFNMLHLSHTLIQ